jgi:hypothetical protein
VRAAINAKDLPWTLGEAGASVAYVLVVARRGAREIRVVSRTATGQRTSVLAHPISAPVQGYVVFLVPVPLHSHAAQASIAKSRS